MCHLQCSDTDQVISALFSVHIPEYVVNDSGSKWKDTGVPCTPHSSCLSSRSACTVLQHHQVVKYRSQAVPVTRPQVWNCLPECIAPSPLTFCRRLETSLFIYRLLFNGTSTQKGQFVPTAGAGIRQSAKDGQRDTMHNNLSYVITM